MYTVGSLFSGALDGIGLAFQRAGFAARWHVEQDEWRRRVLAHRNPHSQIFGDVKDVGRHNLKPVAAIVGGFPCTDISTAGRRAGLGGGTTRSGLWFEFARIIGELRPRVVFLENADEIVAPIRERGTGRIVEQAPGFAVLGSLAQLGYDAVWGVVPASAVGAPHERARWWCFAWRVAHPNETGFSTTKHERRSAGNCCEPFAPHNADGGGIRAGFEVSDAGGSARTVGVALGDANPLSVEAQRQVWQQGALPRFGAQKLEGASNRAGQAHCDQSDLGRVVLDGLSRRLERLSSTERWAAPLGMQPHPFEPSRLTNDTFDWKARVEAVGDSVCLPVVCAWAECIKAALRAEDEARVS